MQDALVQLERGMKIAYSWARYVDSRFSRNLTRHERIAFTPLLSEFEKQHIEAACVTLSDEDKERLCDLHAELQEYVSPAWRHGGGRICWDAAMTTESEQVETLNKIILDLREDMKLTAKALTASQLKARTQQCKLETMQSMQEAFDECRMNLLNSRKEVRRQQQEIALLTKQKSA